MFGCFFVDCFAIVYLFRNDNHIQGKHPLFHPHNDDASKERTFAVEESVIGKTFV